MNGSPAKIAIITSSLGIGGAERAAAQLSVMLVNLGYDVHIVSVLDHIEYEYRGTLLNLGALKNADDSTLGRLKRLLHLKKYLQKKDFHRIIDCRTRTITWSELIISRWLYDPLKVIYMVHSYNIDFYFPQNKIIAKWIYKKSPVIVAVSDEIKQAIESKYGYKNVLRIYNPVDQKLFDFPLAATVRDRFILSYGRIDDEVKNFSLLIDSYVLSDLPSRNVLLYIMGDGKDKQMLVDKVNSLELSDKIIFMPRQENPFAIVKSALFTVLTSRFEGFPLAIVESLTLGVPVVSVDCKSGPRELITDRQSGLLVENNNPKELARAMNLMLSDTKLYNHCKYNAAASIAHLSVKNIAPQWQKILSQ